MPNISKHIIDNALFYDESKEAIHAFISKWIDNNQSIQEESTLNDNFYKIDIRHKLNRIQKEMKFAQNNLIRYQKLTRREKEIIMLLAKGNNNPKIAEQLFISRFTVEQHRKNINAKLNVKSFPQLMPFVYAFDIL